MIEKEALDFVSKSFSEGKTEKELIPELIEKGHSKEEIAEMFAINELSKRKQLPSNVQNPAEFPVNEKGSGNAIVIVLLVAIIAVFGVIAYFLFFADGINCGVIREPGDKASVCFSDAVQNCKKANVRMESYQSGVITKTSAKVLGGTVDSCGFYMKIDDLIITDEADSLVKALIGPMVDEMKGKYIECTGLDFSNVSVSEMGVPNFKGVMEKAECTGTMMEK